MLPPININTPDCKPSSGNTLSVVPNIDGWIQSMDGQKGVLGIHSTIGSQYKLGEGSSNATPCKITPSFSSSPIWNSASNSTTGVDWKILTKQTYMLYIQGANNIDIWKGANSIPDRGDAKGSRVVSYNPSNGSIEIGGLSSGNIEAINS